MNAVRNAGGVLLTETVRVPGIDRGLSAGLGRGMSRWHCAAGNGDHARVGWGCVQRHRVALHVEGVRLRGFEPDCASGTKAFLTWLGLSSTCNAASRFTLPDNMPDLYKLNPRTTRPRPSTQTRIPATHSGGLIRRRRLRVLLRTAPSLPSGAFHAGHYPRTPPGCYRGLRECP